MTDGGKTPGTAVDDDVMSPEEELEEGLEETFPASDPPTAVQPGSQDDDSVHDSKSLIDNNTLECSSGS